MLAKILGICVAVFSVVVVNAQIPALAGKVNASPKTAVINVDSIPYVVYSPTNTQVKQALYYINGKLFNSSILKTIQPEMLDSLYIEKRSIEIDGIDYYGQVFLVMKKEYQPKYISLIDLKLKYTELGKSPAIFMIDDDLINNEPSTYLVDEKYILKIVVDKIHVAEENLELHLIRLITKTEANIKKANKITIRGTGEPVSE